MAKFKPRARSLDLLGKQQIAGVATALNELFKNAYDAYADNVQADYYESENLFLLRDDGLGMTQHDFETRWLTLGTESKLETKQGIAKPDIDSKKMLRPVMGEKGIGRLAIATLGDQVLVITKARRENEQGDYVVAYINWSMFELPGIDLDEIDIQVQSFSDLESITSQNIKKLTEKATENLEGLKDKIEIKVFNRILVQMKNFEVPDAVLRFEMDGPNIHDGGTAFVIKPAGERLIYDIKETTEAEKKASDLHLMLCGFTNTMIKSDVPIKTAFKFHGKDGRKEDLISGKNFFTEKDFESADHHIKGEFDEYGNFRGTLSVYHMPEEEIHFKLNETSEKLDCGAFSISFGYLQGNRSESLLPPEEYAQLSHKCDKMGGLYIYKDGIRILPYGRPDYDFLGIEQRRSRRASTYFFSYRRMLGAIELSKIENFKLTEKSGREGFQENKAYKDFKRILEEFLVRLAQTYFSSGKEEAQNYKKEKDRIKQNHEIRKEREKYQKSYNNKLAQTLETFFDYIEQKTKGELFQSDFQVDLVSLADSIANQLKAVKATNDPLKNMRLIKEAEDFLNEKYTDILKHVEITRDSSIGLTTDLERKWEYYLRKKEECLNKLNDSKHDLFNEISETVKSYDLDIEIWLKNHIQTSHRNLEEKLAAEKNNIHLLSTQLEKQVDLFSDNLSKKEQGIVQEITRKLQSLQAKNTTVTEIADLRQEIDTEFANFSNTTSRAFEQLSATIKTVSDNLIFAIESNQEQQTLISSRELGVLESELTRLREAEEENLENIQLGLSVKLINHEFNANIIGVRRAIQDLKGWSDTNPQLEAVYNRIRNGFDHLDTYLNLFTPLERRLNRRATHISGKSIFEFVTSLFEKSLQSENITLDATESFRKHEIISYPSTIYPVFINLIDNAIYWLSTTESEEKAITLDADKDSIFITDNGPGIKEIDRPYIFERGFSKKISGGGMGLYIAKTVLNREEFDLVLEEKLRTGTVFRIKPIKRKEEA